MRAFAIKIKNNFREIGNRAKSSVKHNFVFATLNFLFTILFIQVFQRVFGAQNSILAVILSILMGIYADRDASVLPVRQFLTHLLVLAVMCTAACFSVALGPWLAIPINFAVSFAILFAYTYEYSNHLYFPYILSYLFLVHIAPVTPVQLPFRLIAVAAGTFCMFLYALVLRTRNIDRPLQTALLRLFDLAESRLRSLSEGRDFDCTDQARACVYDLSKNVDKRRGGSSQISDFDFTLLDAGRGMENLILMLSDPVWSSKIYAELRTKAFAALETFRRAVLKKSEHIPEFDRTDFEIDEYGVKLYHSLCYIRDRFAASRETNARKRRSKPPLSREIRAAVSYSPTKFVYALRVSVLLTAFMIPVQYFHLAHGKWLLFTLASVSLPYAEDVRNKGRKRLIATLIGGSAAVVCFSLIPNMALRGALMMLSGYLSFYFAGYVGNYACATVGALGGAVAAGITGWSDVSAMFAVRLVYISAGILIAYLANLVLFPYRRRRASEALFRNYDASAKLLTCLDGSVFFNPQIYYDLVVRNNLLEEKLLKNSRETDQFQEVTKLVIDYRSMIRCAHRTAMIRAHASQPG